MLQERDVHAVFPIAHIRVAVEPSKFSTFPAFRVFLPRTCRYITITFKLVISIFISRNALCLPAVYKPQWWRAFTKHSTCDYARVVKQQHGPYAEKKKNDEAKNVQNTPHAGFTCKNNTKPRLMHKTDFSAKCGDNCAPHLRRFVRQIILTGGKQKEVPKFDVSREYWLGPW